MKKFRRYVHCTDKKNAVMSVQNIQFLSFEIFIIFASLFQTIITLYYLESIILPFFFFKKKKQIYFNNIEQSKCKIVNNHKW